MEKLNNISVKISITDKDIYEAIQQAYGLPNKDAVLKMLLAPYDFLRSDFEPKEDDKHTIAKKFVISQIKENGKVSVYMVNNYLVSKGLPKINNQMIIDYIKEYSNAKAPKNKDK